MFLRENPDPADDDRLFAKKIFSRVSNGADDNGEGAENIHNDG